MSHKQKQETQNTYGSPTPFHSPATDALQGMVHQGSDPSIPYSYAQRRQDQQNTYRNPLGAYTSSAVRDAENRVANEQGSMDEQQAVQRSRFQQQQAEFNRQLAVAGATMPFQTGGTTTQSQSLLPGLISAGAGIGQAALTKGA